MGISLSCMYGGYFCNSPYKHREFFYICKNLCMGNIPNKTILYHKKFANKSRDTSGIEESGANFKMAVVPDRDLFEGLIYKLSKKNKLNNELPQR